jgi:hypothetical protein
VKTRSFTTTLLLGFEVLDPHISCFAQTKPQPFSLTLSVSQSVVSANAKFVVKVLLTNASDKDIVVLQCGFTDYTVKVERIGGAKVPETEVGRQLNDRSLGRVCMSTRTVLKPKEAVKDEIVVNDLYQLDSPGQYVIRVFREIPEWMGSRGTVASNPLTVTMTKGRAGTRGTALCSRILTELLNRSCLPAFQKQLIEAVVRMGADAREQIPEITKRLDAQTFATCDQATQHGSGSSAFVAPIKKPVIATNHDGSETPLGRIVIDLQFAVFRVAQQCLPVGQDVVDSIADRAFR